MQTAPPAPRYSRFVHQLSDFPHIQHLRTELRAHRLDAASPLSLRPTRQRWYPVTDDNNPYFSMSSVSTTAAAVKGPAPVATETSSSGYVIWLRSLADRIVNGINGQSKMMQNNGAMRMVAESLFLISNFCFNLSAPFWKQYNN